MRSRQAMPFLLALSLAGSVSLSAAPVSARMSSAPNHAVYHQPTAASVQFDGVSFSYSRAIAATVSGHIAPAQRGISGSLPRAIQFGFQGYPRWGRPGSAVRQEGPSWAFVKVFPMAGLSDQYVRAQVAQVKHILRTRPNLARVSPLPLVPAVNAGQGFHVKARYLNFRNGHGFSYIGYWAQAAFPLSNEDPVFYTYQGITNDGRYFVSIQLPLRVSALPDHLPSGTLTPQEKRIIAHWNAYIGRIARTLNALPGYRYRPNLGSIYAMVQSIRAQPQGFGR